MRPTLRTPSPRRARRWGAGLGAVGTAVGTVAGALPIGIKRRRRRPPLSRLAVPITGGAVLLGAALRRRRKRSDVPDWSSSYTPAEPTPSPVTDNGGADPVVAGTEAFAPPVPASAADTPIDEAAPTLPTDAVDTATGQARLEEVEGPGVEGVAEVPRDAAGETPASSEAGEGRPS